MPTLSSLLSDPKARIEVIIKGQILDDNGDSQTYWFSRSGWSDPPGGPAAQYCKPLVDISLRVSQSLDPLEPQTLIDTPYSQIELINDSIAYAGYFDGWYLYSVDNLEWNIYLVGYLSTGERVDLSDTINDPIYTLTGIGIPEISSSTCLIRARGLEDILSVPLQPVTYSPPALYFPGSPTAVVDLGDNLNITGDQSLSFWVYLEDLSTTQYALFKDSGAQGYYVAVGLVGGGTIVGGVEILVRGQSPTTTTTAANVLRTYRWHRIDISIAAATRRIDIDGTTAITTSSITGTPTASTTSLTFGQSLKGRLHRVLYWSNTRTNAVMSAEGRTPITEAETNLREAFLFNEGRGAIAASSKSGSSLSGTLAAGILWDSASWHYESLLGQYEPYVLGTVPRVPVTWIDPPKQIGQVSRGPIALLSELQSNHAMVSTANYTSDLSNGTLTLTTGAISGTYSATVTANNLWNSALLLNGSTSGATVAVTMPAGSKYIACQIRLDGFNTAGTLRQILGWNAATSSFLLRFFSTTNLLSLIAVNDAGVTFQAFTTLPDKKRFSILGSLDIANPSTGLNLYIDGILIHTVAISGNWTGTQPTLGIGRRSSVNDFHFPGVIDEIVIGNTAATLAMAQEHHSHPVDSTFPGVIAGWHCDDGTGSAAVSFVGAASLTLANVSWTAGRSACTDLARSILFAYGYDEADLDFDSWLIALNKSKGDCGWFVSQGAKGIDILNVVLGGLGFVLYRSSVGLLKLKRFEGVSGAPDINLDPDIDLQLLPIESLPSDPVVYQWIVTFATNNTKLDSANIAGSLASTDPDRYQYGSSAHRSAPKSDGSILERFPSAEPRTRTTALLNLIDAEEEAARLLVLHRYGADRKSIAVFAGVGGFEILTEIGPLMEELDLDDSDMLITGISIEEGEGTIEIWRPGSIVSGIESMLASADEALLLGDDGGILLL